MDNRQLEVFTAVARAGSFTGAARALHVVQSAISARVALLETDLGERLFDRTTRTLRLTAAGHALMPHAIAILDALQAARDSVEAISGGLSGSIRIGYMTNVTLFDIPGLLGRFNRDYPAVTLNLTPALTGTAGLLEALRRRDLDLAFVAASPADHPDLRMDLLAESPIGLAVPASDALSSRSRISLAEASDLRFADVREGFGNRTLMERELRKRGLRREVPIETSDMTDLAALVRNGLGAAFLPRYLVQTDDDIHWIELSDIAVSMPVSLATRRDRPPGAAADRLADLTRTHAHVSLAERTPDAPRIPPECG